MILCVVASLFGLPTKAMTDESLYSGFIFEAFYTEKDYIEHFADEYQAPKHELLVTGTCESTLNQEAVGDNGTSFGTFQYKIDTWNRYSKLMGEVLDIDSKHDQAKLTAFIFKNYPREKVAWTCYRDHFL